MRLTDKEIEIMNVLWKGEAPMTATEIVAASPERTWKDISIHVLLKSLLMKNAVIVDHFKPTSARAAKAYRTTVTVEEYAAKHVRELGVDVAAFLGILMDDGKGRK